MAAWAAFLEAQPPNIALTIPALLRTQERLRRLSWNIRLPPIDIHCDRDGGFRRFSADQDSLDLKNPPESYSFITYRCRNCEETTKTFAVMIHWNPLLDDSNAEVMKLGEYPPFSAPISPRIKKLLSPSDLELFRKGNRATDQGLGIGAASYFRRVVENQWSHLVTEIKQAAERLGVEDLSVYDAALQETQFSRAVEMLSDAIPEKLLILEGQNPLTLLYRPLSQQLHGRTDEQCLKQAAAIRTVLTSLLENIADVLKDQDKLRVAARTLSDAGPGRPKNRKPPAGPSNRQKPA